MQIFIKKLLPVVYPLYKNAYLKIWNRLSAAPVPRYVKLESEVSATQGLYVTDRRSMCWNCCLGARYVQQMCWKMHRSVITGVFVYYIFSYVASIFKWDNSIYTFVFENENIFWQNIFYKRLSCKWNVIHTYSELDRVTSNLWIWRLYFSSCCYMFSRNDGARG